jgi:hypothetical protein
MSQRVIVIDPVHEWEPNDPGARLVATDGGDARLTLRPHPNDDDERDVAFVWSGCRLAQMGGPNDEAIEGGTPIDEAAGFGVAFARAGADWLSVSKGGKFEDAKPPRVGEAAYPYTGPSGHECMPTVYGDARGPFGRNVPLAAAIRAAVRAAGCATPVVTAGGIATFDQAEGILARGEADVVAAARQSLADPDWFEKVRTGRGAAVRRCEFTNYCEGLDQRHLAVTCKRWDRAFTPGDPAVRTSPDGRRRLVAPDAPPAVRRADEAAGPGGPGARAPDA